MLSVGMKEFITQTLTISALNLFTAVRRFYAIFAHIPLSLTVSHMLAICDNINWSLPWIMNKASM
jgi:hypothetical protein